MGCVDGTHIQIPSPSLNPVDFINRKNYYSINVQVVCDHQLKINNLVAKWPGSAHDSWILQQSQVWTNFENGTFEGLLLGDSAYPCKRWLMSPFRNPTNAPQLKFNSSHKYFEFNFLLGIL